MPHPAFFVVFGQAAGAVLLGWLFFRRFAVTRPPIGVFNRGDTLIVIGAVILLPAVYLALPGWLTAALLGLGTLSVLYAVWEPVLRARWAIWLLSLALLVADAGAALVRGTTSAPYLLVNDVVLVVAVVGVANLWAQSGMRARDAALLTGALTLYDLIATGFSSMTLTLITRLAELPFSPLLAWDLDRPEAGLGLGIGDLLVATLVPLVMRKAFGRTAGRMAVASVLITIGGMLVLLDSRLIGDGIPALVALGPVLLAQYAYWARRRGSERSTWQYLQAEPRGRRATQPAA